MALNNPARATTPPLLKPRRRRNRGVGDGGSIGVYLALAIVFGASVFPLYWSLVISSYSEGDLSAGINPLSFGSSFLDNVQRAFTIIDFGPALANTVIVATVTAVANTLLSALAGFAFARLPFRGRNGLFLAVVITAMVPTQLGVVPLYILMGEIGWIGSLNAVIVPALVSAFGVFWMRQAAEESVPYELIEAARVDGASTLRTFWTVGLPSIRGQAAVLFMFVFMAAWNDFFWPLIVLNDPSTRTLQTALAALRGGYSIDVTLVITGATIVVAPLLIVFVVFSRQIVGGIMQGAVKG